MCLRRAHHIESNSETHPSHRTTRPHLINEKARVSSTVASAPAGPVAPRPERIEEFDALRGIAILFVMYLHAYFGPWSTTPPGELLFLRLTHIVANSAVPVFLFMSGFLGARDRSPTSRALIEPRLRGSRCRWRSG